MVQYKIHYTWGSTVSKNIFYGKQFTTVTTYKNVQNYYDEKCTNTVKTRCNFLYALKVWNWPLFEREG